MENASEKSFPLNAKDYEVCEEVGEGVSATVYKARCIPLDMWVAVKILDLEKCNNDTILAGIRREVQTMSSIDHPNVLRSYCSFADDQKLWVVMPFMDGGSCLHIMKSLHPDGFEEPVIAKLLHEVLKALAYLHAHGYIHRDVKAGNILIDSEGAVKLGDFGVSACMFDTGDRQRSRNTFVGTPCWMAPEVMQQLHGYDFKADIWSFGITALELARGHAPFSKYPPMKVLLMTLQNAPPGLDYKRDKKFSKYFRSLVAACLVKDPKKRPSSEKLLKHRFFQKLRSNDYIAKTLVSNIAPLGDRYRTLKASEADLIVQNKAIYGDKEKLSQQEYIRGISGWNFNLEDLKSEASLSQDYDSISNTEDLELYCKQKDGCEEKHTLERVTPRQESMDSSSASDPISPGEDPKGYDVVQSECEQSLSLISPKVVEEAMTKNDDGNLYRSSSIPNNVIYGDYEKSPSSYPLANMISPSRKVNGSDDREFMQQKYQIERNCSVGDISEGTIIRRKGRFKVMSEELSPKGAPITPVNPDLSSNIAPTIFSTSVLPSLQSILQQTNAHRDTLVKLIKSVEATLEIADTGTNDLPQISPCSVRERELQALVSHLQQSNEDLVKELQRLKMENAQLENQVSGLPNKEDGVVLKENEG